MREIRIQNPNLDSTYKTFLASDYSSGTTATVINNSSFAANDIGVFGEPIEELTESKKIDSISGSTTLTLASALNFAHAKGTSIYKTLWDFVSIEGRSSSAGTFAELTQSGIQWDNKNNETLYFHSSGDDNWEYRYRFYNSVTATYSEYSPTLTGAGFTRKMVGYMIRQVRLKTNDLERKIVSDDDLIRVFTEAQDIIYSHNPAYWFLLVDTYKAGTGIAAVAATNVYSLASYTTFGHLDTVRYLYNSGGTNSLYHIKRKSEVEFDYIASDLNQTSDDYARIYKLLPADSSSANGYIQIYPKTKNSSVGTLYPNYYEKMTDLDSVDDLTQVPLPEILESYGIAYVEKVRGNEAKAKIYESKLVSDNPDMVPAHLLLLDKLDKQQKSSQGQPKQLVRFRGQKAVSRLYGTPYFSRDYLREFSSDF